MKFSIVIMVGLVTVSQAAVFQWSGNGHLYEPVSVPQTISWTDAKVAAEQAGGYLATITSSEENTFVHSLINSDLYWNGNSGPWIGGYQPEGSPEPAGGWRWVTGEAFTYANWATDQPNNTNGQEGYLQFGYSNKTSKWNDNDITGTNGDNRPIVGYIVEFELNNPVQWSISEGGNGHLYRAVAVPEGITWHAAKIEAEMAGGYLATITSQEENEFVGSLITADLFWICTGPSCLGPWLGGFQIPASAEPDEGWQWITGEQFTYANWVDGQPNNKNGNENFLHFWYNTSRSPTWNDVANDYQIIPGYIIEYPPCRESIEGDINNDCKVDLSDLSIMASHWLDSTWSGVPAKDLTSWAKEDRYNKWSFSNPTPESIRMYETAASDTVAPGWVVSDFLLYPTSTFTTTLKVLGSSDDDFVGLIFGYQDTDHFYLLDWKRSTQTFNWGDPVTINDDVAEQGIRVKKVAGSWTRDGLWGGTDGLGVSTLAGPVGGAWNFNTSYTFTMDLSPGHIIISLDGTPLFDIADDTFIGGRIGVYGFSQDNLLFSNVSVNPDPHP